MSDLAFNIWGAVSGVFFALIPAILLCIRARLPSRNLPYLAELLNETQNLFYTAIREGLLTDTKEFNELKLNIWYATVQMDEIRAEVYDSKSWVDDVQNWWRGLSGTISTLHHELVKTRVRLVKITSKGRKLRASEGYVTLSSEDKGGHAHGCPAILISTSRPSCTPLASPMQLDLPGVASSDLASGAVSGTLYPTEGSARHGRHTLEDDGTCPPPYREPRAPNVSPSTLHNISDEDLQDLLSLALLHPVLQQDAAKRERAMRRKILLRFGMQLCEPEPGVTSGVGEDATRDAERHRMEAFCRLAGPGTDDAPLRSSGAGDALNHVCSLSLVKESRPNEDRSRRV